MILKRIHRLNSFIDTERAKFEAESFQKPNLFVLYKRGEEDRQEYQKHASVLPIYDPEGQEFWAKEFGEVENF